MTLKILKSNIEDSMLLKRYEKAFKIIRIVKEWSGTGPRTFFKTSRLRIRFQNSEEKGDNRIVLVLTLVVRPRDRRVVTEVNFRHSHNNIPINKKHKTTKYQKKSHFKV
jgi:hypothetical protein